MKDVIEKLGIRKRIEIFSGISEDGKVKVNYGDLLDKEYQHREMLKRDFKFREYLFNEIDKYIRMGDTGNVSLLREIWENFDFTIDEISAGKSWDEIKELIK